MTIFARFLNHYVMGFQHRQQNASNTSKADKKMLVYGIHPVLEAIESGKQFDKLLVQTGKGGEAINKITQYCRQHDIPVQHVPAEKLNRTVSGNHQGVVGYLGYITYHKLENVLPFVYEQGETPLFLILDGVTDVRNLGAIARSALCMGCQALIIPEKGVAPINAEAIKSSAGALHQIHVCREKYLDRTVEWLQENGLPVYALEAGGDKAIHEVDFSEPVAVVMGDEGQGISKRVLANVDGQVAIPMQGNFDSLNVSVAAGMVLYEASRQRGGRG